MKAVTLLSIGAILAASYMGGKMTNTGVAEYEYAEVYNVVGECPEGQFTGSCTDCQECVDYEYNAGGCSYFKDTLCILCEDIPHCSTVENAAGALVPAITCTDQYDHTCSICEPGYWDLDCKPCKVCEAGWYESAKCTQTSNTECTACTTCTSDEFVSKSCTYFTDSECQSCDICTPGFFAQVECGEPQSVYTVNPDTICAPCTEPAVGEFVTETCTIMTDTVIETCAVCAEREQYISDDCDPGTWHTPGEDIQCSDCKTRPNGAYTVWHCDSAGYKDSLHQKCSECQDGEYLFADCTASSDTVCPDCTGIEHCKDDALRCTGNEDSTCEDCKTGYYGDTCCYERGHSACGSITTRERRADQYGYEGETNEEFINFCLDLCDEFPDCMAFEIEDGGTGPDESGDNQYSVRGASCHFKSAYTSLTDDYSQDCYSNMCRQNA